MLEEDGRLVGALVLEDLGHDALLLDNVAVAPSAQGKGYGRALVAFAEAEARRRGHGEVRLYTHVLMTENQALYARLGFKEIGRVKEKGYERLYRHRVRNCGDARRQFYRPGATADPA